MNYPKKQARSVLVFSIFFLFQFSCSLFNYKQGAIVPRPRELFLSVANIDSSVAFYLKAFDLKTNRFPLRIEQGDSVLSEKENGFPKIMDRPAFEFLNVPFN
jgi:hypothetical protein